jgi:hypothetical protein
MTTQRDGSSTGAASYQARPIKSRTRRTKAQVAQLEQQIFEVLLEDHPQSVRHVFYRMTNPRLPEPVVKSDQGYDQVQDRITKMRRAGTIPYGWITDATRQGYHTATYPSAADALRAWAGAYRGDLWQGADDYVEVWCESRSIAGVIEPMCRDYAVSLYPAGGFTSLSLAFQAAEYINEVTENGLIPANVIYIGDYDPAGVLIDRKIEAEIREHLHPDVTLTFHRIAITEQQIAAHDLPSKARNPKDKRALHIDRTVEAEAMPAAMMRSLLQDWIEAFLPAEALATAKAAEESERRLINWVADHLDGAA